MCEMHRIAVAAAVVGLVALGSTARAQSKTTTYQVEFEKVANSCRDTGMTLSKAKIELARRGRRLTVTVPMIPIMKGRAGKRGKFKAQARRGKTAIAGLDGKFRIAGEAHARTIQFVFVAEYYKGATPLCTQSWKGAGKATEARTQPRSGSGPKEVLHVMQPVTAQSSSGPSSSRSPKSSTSSSP